MESNFKIKVMENSNLKNVEKYVSENISIKCMANEQSELANALKDSNATDHKYKFTVTSKINSKVLWLFFNFSIGILANLTKNIVEKSLKKVSLSFRIHK